MVVFMENRRSVSILRFAFSVSPYFRKTCSRVSFLCSRSAFKIVLVFIPVVGFDV